MPLTKRQIAKEIGCSPGNLSKGKFKDMPRFQTIDEFKQWDIATRRQGDPKFINLVSADDAEAEEALPAGSIDWRKFKTNPDTHLDINLNRGMQISNMAYALVDAAVERGDIAATFGAIKNWSATLREESDVREKLIQQRLQQRSIIPLDEVKHIVGMILQEFVVGIETMINQGAIKANPNDPKRALNSYQEEFDGLKIRMQGALKRIELELADAKIPAKK